MARHWDQIGEIEHLHGRAGLREDEVGSRLLAAALVREIMRLGFLQEGRYPPYPKWLGTATDPKLKEIDHPAGSIDSVADNAVVLTWPGVWRRLRGLYDRA